MCSLRCDRQVRIDGRRKGMNQFRPARVPGPERTATDAAEVALGLALNDRAGVRIGNPGLVHRNIFLARHLQGRIVTAPADGVAATSPNW